MNRIRDMIAGPELDRMIAERITGHVPTREWRIVMPDGSLRYSKGYPRDGRAETDGEATAMGGKAELIDCADPLYSECVEEAWELLEKWEGDYEIRRQNDHFKLTLFRPSEQIDDFATTLPLAVCRCLLIADIKRDRT